MRKIIAGTWISLDGYIAGAHGEMDWVSSIYSKEMGMYEETFVSNADLLLLGKTTYESFASSWPFVPEKEGVSEEEKAYARKLNAMQKIVFTKTLQKADWEHTTIMNEIIPEKIRALKQQEGKDIIIYGSASIVQTLTNVNLIDEYQLLIHPVILGSGKALFSGVIQKHMLSLVTSKVFSSGVIVGYYRPKEG